MKRNILTIAFGLFFHFGFAQDEAFRKDVIKLIDMNGTSTQVKIIRDQMIKLVPKEKQADFDKDFEASLPELYKKNAANYMKVYTNEDIKEMIAFYESRVGKKMVSSSAEMAIRTRATSEEWMGLLQAIVNKYSLP